MIKPPVKYTAIKYLKKAIRIASDVSDLAVQITKKPSGFGLVALGSKALNTLIEQTSNSTIDFFDSWKVLDLKCMGRPVRDFFKNLGMIYVPIQKDSCSVNVVTVGESTFGWHQDTDYVENHYTPPGLNQETIKKDIVNFFWEKLNSSICFEEIDRELSFKEDILNKTLPSKTATEIWEKQKKFIQAGHNRAVLLYGDPGTGKSYIIRQIANLAGGRYLRIKARNLGESKYINNIVSFLDPSVILIDDLDRILDPGSIINTLEEIKVKCKLLLVTVNNIKQLDPASLRPGRFDELINIERIDAEVLEKLMDGFNEKEKIKLRNLPVAYIDEYKKLKTTLGNEAIKELDSLVERVIKVKDLMCSGYSLEFQLPKKQKKPTLSRKVIGK